MNAFIELSRVIVEELLSGRAERLRANFYFIAEEFTIRMVPATDGGVTFRAKDTAVSPTQTKRPWD